MILSNVVFVNFIVAKQIRAKKEAKMIIRDVLRIVPSQNTYMNQIIHRIISCTALKNVMNICDEMVSFDTIKDVYPLKAFRQEIEKGKIAYKTKDINFENTHYYGIWHTLFGWSKDSIVETPAIEHGLILYNMVCSDTRFTARAGIATLGKFRQDIIQKYQKIPVFTVGPYIHYAESFYSTSIIIEEKKKLGKTLVVFPIHSSPSDKYTIPIKQYCNYLSKLARNFNSVLVCTYWWDLNSPMIDMLSAEGYRIVSAGFEDDVSFLSRLKSILSLADFTAGNSIGTHIGYCVYMGKPFLFIDTGYKFQSSRPKRRGYSTDFYNSIEQKIKKVFLDTETVNEHQRAVCNLYWGLDQIKTREELEAICQITQSITRRAKGFTAIYPKVAHKLLYQYQEADPLKYQLLQDALPTLSHDKKV